MPAKSQAQRGLIFSRRDQYGSKKNTPKKWKWIWDEDWENKGKLPKKKMKKKNESLVPETLDSFLNESLDWGDKYNTPQEEWISPEEAEALYMEALDMSNTPEELVTNMQAVFDKNLYMHQELGEVEGHDYYAEAIKNFTDAAKDKFPGVFA